jgi:hypothetical protein
LANIGEIGGMTGSFISSLWLMAGERHAGERKSLPGSTHRTRTRSATAIL